MKRIIRHASLFSGIGAPELAALWLGWQNIFHCEISEFCNTILSYWLPDSIGYEDIKTTDFSKWDGKIDVLTGGFPCQPFSAAGQRRGAEDDRYLWPEMLRAVWEIQPTFVVGENVAGILSMVQPSEAVKMGSKATLFEESDDIYRKEQQFVIETICTDLERAGYSVQPFVIPACAVGAPHRRDRVWIVAHRADARAESLQQGWQDGISEFGFATHAKFDGGHKMVKEMQSEVADGQRINSISCKRSSSNTERKRRLTCKYDDEKSEIAQEKECRTKQLSGADSPQSWWREFPSVSPVCNGNDGLPFDVADLSIPLARWRQESIKALGNSMVPQVILELFRAIENEILWE